MTTLLGTDRIVALDDGAQTHLTQWGSHGPAIVCIHGMTSSRYAWTRFARRFSERFRIFAYDQRGHGDSAHVLGPMSLQQGEADLHAVCDAVDGEIEALVGHSWGGAIGLRGGRVTRAKRVVAIDPVIYVDPHFDWYEEYLADFDADRKLSPEDREIEIRRRYRGFGWSEDDVEAKLQAVCNMVLEPLERLEAENNVGSGGWDLRETVTNYPKPLLLALADANESTVTAAERDWLANYAGPNVSTIVYDGLGHNLHRTDFDRFADDVDAWFKKT